MHGSALLLFDTISTLQIQNCNKKQVSLIKSPLTKGDLGGCVFSWHFYNPPAPFSKGDFMHDFSVGLWAKPTLVKPAMTNKIVYGKTVTHTYRFIELHLAV